MEYFYSAQAELREKTTKKFNVLLSKNEGLLPTIVIAEIIRVTCTIRGKDMAQSRYKALIQSGIEVQNLSPPIAEQAGLFKSQYSNLPMGDCIIAATALLNHARVLSDDPYFDCIHEIKRVWI